MANSKLDAFLRRGRAQHGERFDPRDVLDAEQFHPFFGTGQRIRVESTYGNTPDAETFTRTGTVSVTGGWRPALLLMHRSNAHGSWDVLSTRDKITAVKRGRHYQEV